MPIDDWLPEYDVHERHERRIAASPERALELALTTPAAPDRLVATLFRLRGVPRADTLAELLEALAIRERERTATSFVALSEGRIRIAVDFVARDAEAGSVLSTETRVLAADARSRVAFRAYWLVVGPFSALIRRRWLRSVAKAAGA